MYLYENDYSVVMERGIEWLSGLASLNLPCDTSSVNRGSFFDWTIHRKNESDLVRGELYLAMVAMGIFQFNEVDSTVPLRAV